MGTRVTRMNETQFFHLKSLAGNIVYKLPQWFLLRSNKGEGYLLLDVIFEENYMKLQIRKLKFIFTIGFSAQNVVTKMLHLDYG